MIEIGAPSREDYSALARLLPEAFPLVGEPAELLVARVGGALAGAAAIAWSAGGFPVWIHVEPARRRRGIGRALMQAAIDEARGETTVLKAWHLLEDGSAAASLAVSCGFIDTKRLRYFSADPASSDSYFNRLLDRFRRRIPATVRVVPVQDVSSDALTAMLADAFDLSPAAAAQRFASTSTRPYHPTLSKAVVDGGTLAGAILCRADGDVVDVEVNMVAVGYRGGWANLLLLAAMARAGKDAGIGRFIFGGEAHVRDTVNLSRRSGAIRLPDRVTFTLPL